MQVLADLASSGGSKKESPMPGFVAVSLHPASITVCKFSSVSFFCVSVSKPSPLLSETLAGLIKGPP